MIFYMNKRDAIRHYPKCSIRPTIELTPEYNARVIFNVSTSNIPEGTELQWDITNDQGTKSNLLVDGPTYGIITIQNHVCQFEILVRYINIAKMPQFRARLFNSGKLWSDTGLLSFDLTSMPKNIKIPRGFVGAGMSTNSIKYNTVDVVDFVTDTISSMNNTMSVARSNLTSTSSKNHGFFIGGVTKVVLTKVDSMSFETESFIPINTKLTNPRYDLTSANTDNFALVGGGFNNAIFLGDFEKLEFATNVFFTSSATLITARQALAGICDKKVGYFGGGNTKIFSNTIDSVELDTETSNANQSTLQSPRRGLTSVQSDTNGYFIGGGSSIPLKTVDKFSFDTQTTINSNVDLLNARLYSCGVSNKSDGYILGGKDQPGYLSGIEKLQYDTDTVNVINMILTTPKQASASFNNL